MVKPLGDLGRYIVEFAFGDIYSRGVLTLREREIATVAMLTVLGREPQLRLHIGVAVNVGLSPRKLRRRLSKPCRTLVFLLSIERYYKKISI